MSNPFRLYNVQIFFVVLRETLEAVVVVSVLLAFLKQGLGGAADDPKIYKRLRKQVWLGSLVGLIICICIGAGFIGAFYGIGKDVYGNSEDIWEGVFSVFATVLITFMGLAMLRVNKMKEKWRVKLAQALVKERPEGKGRFNISHLTKKYCMFILPFITTLREGLEAVVFVGGAGLAGNGAHHPASSFPLPVLTGLIAGILVGVGLYYFGSTVSMQIFLIISTCILYLIGAGLFSRAVWYFETYRFNQLTGGDASESGDGPGSYDIATSVWHVNCCNPELDNGWDVFNSLLGWQNSATYGSVISYNVYWIFIITVIGLMYFEEKKGHLPFCKNLTLKQLNPMYYIKGKKNKELTKEEQEALFARVRNQRYDELINEEVSNEEVAQKTEATAEKIQ